MIPKQVHVLIGAALLVTLATATPYASALETPHARVSFADGTGMVKGAADEDWSYATLNVLILADDILWVDENGTLEVELPGGTFLRMADQSNAQILAMPPAGRIWGITGSFYVQRLKQTSGDLVFETEAGDIQVAADSQVRIDVLSAGTVIVSVRWGQAIVSAPGGQPVSVPAGQRIYIDPGYLPSQPMPFDRSNEDDFDAWNRERARILAVGVEATPKIVTTSYSEPLGTADLGLYGDWVYVDSRPYWRPTVVVDYVPYRYGYWSYVPVYGYCWVEQYPFSYVTSHYGRWSYYSDHGWLWCYDDVWAPAWVATVRSGSNFIWCPLDPWDRPVVTGSAYFDLDGIRFGITTSSFCSADNLLYWGYTPVQQVNQTVINNINIGEINVWNIYAGDSDRIRSILPRSSAPVKDFTPQRQVRGPNRFEGEEVRAGDRSVKLDSRFREDRKQLRGTAELHRERKPAEVPTQGREREGLMRSTRLKKEVLTQTQNEVREVENRTSRMKTREESRPKELRSELPDIREQGVPETTQPRSGRERTKEVSREAKPDRATDVQPGVGIQERPVSPPPERERDRDFASRRRKTRR